VNILVTGGAGYVGSIVTDELIKEGHKVTVLDALLKGRGHRDAVNTKAHFEFGDYGDDWLVPRILEENNIDTVIHLAANTNVEQPMTNPSIYFNNVSATIRLLDAMMKLDVKRFIYSSSATVYGQTGNRPCREDDVLKPISSYGESKLMVETILKWYKSAYGLDYVAFRYFNVAGATELRGQDHTPESTIIPCLIQTIMKGDIFNIYGVDYPTEDGTAVRDYVHVSDIAQAHILALDKLNKVSGMAFNLSSVSGYSVRQVINCASEVVGTVVQTKECLRRAGDPAILLADSNLARLKLGWTPKYTDMRNTIQSAWDWQVKYPYGY
jgi:UDP-glucose 4-epimerase